MPTFPRSPLFDGAPDSRVDTAAVIPVVQEEIDVGTRVVDTGVVRVRTVTERHEEMLRLPLDREDVIVERIAIGRAVDEPVEVRQEGDVTIVPVHEEVLVTRRQLVLREELHIRRRVSTVESAQPVVLHRQDVHIEREPLPGATPH